MSALLFVSAGLLLLFLTILYSVYELIYKQKRIYDMLQNQNVPGDPFVPVVGHISRFSKDDQILRVRQQQQEKYGNIYLLSFGHRVNLVLVDPDYIGDVLRRCSECYKKPELFRIVFGPLIGGTKNLFASEGDHHRRLRKMLNPAFQHSKLQSMATIMIEQTEKHINDLLSQIVNHHLNEFDLDQVFYKLTLSIIVSSLFGQDISETKSNKKEILSDAYKNAIKAIEYRSSKMVNQIPLIKDLPLWKKDIVDKGTKEIGKFVEEVTIDYRRKHDISSLPLIDNSDILSVLLSATDQYGIGLNDKELKEETMSFLFAGHEASSNLMTWCLHVLMMNNDIYQDCQDEVDRILDDMQPPDFHKLNQLEILDAVLHETLRIYPPLPSIRRECIKEHCIGPPHRQLRIPVGTSINIDVYNVHRSSQYWKDPLIFNYKRWLGDERRKSFSNSYCFLPFSAGNRSCIGQPFALLEAKVVLSMLLQRLKFEPVYQTPVVQNVQLTMKPKHGLPAKIFPKTQHKN